MPLIENQPPPNASDVNVEKPSPHQQFPSNVATGKASTEEVLSSSTSNSNALAKSKTDRADVSEKSKVKTEMKIGQEEIVVLIDTANKRKPEVVDIDKLD